MQSIKLSKYGSAIVDDDDYDTLRRYRWHMSARGYVARSVWKNGKSETIYMHRQVMGAKKGMDIDHINMNKLDNRKENLRLCSRSENMRNMRKYKDKFNMSKFKGVSKLNRKNLKRPWIAYIKHNYKQIHLGYFETQEDAAKAYDVAAKEMFGEFANTNF